MNSLIATLPDIPDIVLRGLQEDFDVIRAAGFKAIYRFAYAQVYPRPWAGDGSSNCPQCPEPNDINVIFHHIDQLAAVINANKELVLAVEMGTLGYWYFPS